MLDNVTYTWYSSRNVSYAETFRIIEADLPEIEALLAQVEMTAVFIEVPQDWFLKFDIEPRGLQMTSRMSWLLSRGQFEELADTRPGLNRREDVGYRWKEVY